MEATKGGPNLYEFLIEAELPQYFNSLKTDLKVTSAHQIKYVQDEDLIQLGMSKPEMRRLRKFFNKYYPQTYLKKIKKIMKSNKRDGIDKPYNIDIEPSIDKSTVKVPSKHIISADSLVINKQLGVGEFGVVEQGVWTNEEGERIQVAIKCLSKEKIQNNHMEFLKEAAIMHSIDNEHIVHLYGAVLGTTGLMLVTELAPLRSLLECLKEPVLRSSFPVISLCEFALQICDGMQYLEAKRLIHRDLAARNVLVFGKYKVKISDFGLSRALGVGKDYYQTNFNVNLKLPIAWCAPECINFLRFTSASDVWAYGVTLWEMFSYGFQPWAALTGQQILEAIDEPNFQRLEQPECCPKDYYNLMLKCWQHDPMKRPRFSEIYQLLPECKPEQVQAVKDSIIPGKAKKEMLQYKVEEVITVLDKKPDPNSTLWKGVLVIGKTGFFNPSNTVAYLGQNLPSFSRPDMKSGGGLYASKRRLCPEMISRPQDDLRHTGHVGLDGAFFGDVTFLGDKYQALPKQVVNPYKPQDDKDSSISSTSQIPSDTSDKTPLLTKSNSLKDQSDFGYQAAPIDIPGKNLLNLNDDVRKKNRKSGGVDHEYHEISDDEKGSPKFELFDMGPSLLDEVFMALTCNSTLANDPPPPPLSLPPEPEEPPHQTTSNNVKNELKEITSKWMANSKDTLTRKKQTLVKPISAHDEHTLDSAIAMAKEIATKSMLEQDSKDELDANPTTDSPKTPNTPTKKKFAFLFNKSSPKAERRNFSQEAESISSIDDTLSESAKEAYNSLVEKSNSTTLERNSISHPIPGSLVSTIQQHQGFKRIPAIPQPPPLLTSMEDIVEQNPLRALRQGGLVRPRIRGNKNQSNPPSAPPPPPQPVVNSTTTTTTSNFSASTASSFSASTTSSFSASTTSSFSASTTERLGSFRCALGAPPPPPPPTSNPAADALNQNNPLPLPPRDRNRTLPILKQHQRKYPLLTPSPHLVPVACPQVPTTAETQQQQRKISLDEGALAVNRTLKTQGRTQGLESDEVRIMLKVLDQENGTPEQCLVALNETEWEVHKAIKFVKLQSLVQGHSTPLPQLCRTLAHCDWDVQQAANYLLATADDMDDDTTEV